MGSKLSALASSTVSVLLPTPIVPAIPMYPSANMLSSLRRLDFLLDASQRELHVVGARRGLEDVGLGDEAVLEELDERLVERLHAVELALRAGLRDADRVVLLDELSHV